MKIVALYFLLSPQYDDGKHYYEGAEAHPKHLHEFVRVDSRIVSTPDTRYPTLLFPDTRHLTRHTRLTFSFMMTLSVVLASRHDWMYSRMRNFISYIRQSAGQVSYGLHVTDVASCPAVSGIYHVDHCPGWTAQIQRLVLACKCERSCYENQSYYSVYAVIVGRY